MYYQVGFWVLLLRTYKPNLLWSTVASEVRNGENKGVKQEWGICCLWPSLFLAAYLHWVKGLINAKYGIYYSGTPGFQVTFSVFFFFWLCRRSLLSSNPRMKSHTGNLILSGPSGYRSCAVHAALAVTALSSTRVISQRQGLAWWTKNWNSTLYPVQRSVTHFWDL